MRIIAKTLILFIAFSTSSCSFLSKREVSITIDSEPIGAKIYVDDVYYGETPKEIELVPSKNQYLKLVKDGYQIANLNMETDNNFRKTRLGKEAIRCRLDFVGSIFLLPMLGVNSVQCRDFTKKVYSADLSKVQNLRPVTESYQQDYTPFSSRNYYFPQQQANQAQPNKFEEQQFQNSANHPQQNQKPMVNNNLGYVNQDNEARPENPNGPIDYYSYQ